MFTGMLLDNVTCCRTLPFRLLQNLAESSRTEINIEALAVYVPIYDHLLGKWCHSLLDILVVDVKIRAC